MDVRFNDCVMLGWIVGECWNGDVGLLDWIGLNCWGLLDWNGLENVGNGMLDWLDGVCWIK